MNAYICQVASSSQRRDMAEPGLQDRKASESQCVQETRFTSLIRQLSSTIDSLKATTPDQCLCTLTTAALTPGQAMQETPLEALVQLDTQEPSAVLALRAQLAAKEQEIQTTKAETEAKDAQLQARDEAYGKLSVAHKAALVRLNHALKLLDALSANEGTKSRFYSASAAVDRSKTEGPKTRSEAPKSGHYLPTQEVRALKQSASLVHDDGDSSDLVQFVSERPVRHAKRTSAKADGAEVDARPQRPIKEEFMPPSLPSLKSAITSLTQGLDLDSTDVVPPTPRKTRYSPVPLLRGIEAAHRPVSAPYGETSSPRKGQSGGTQSFSAIDFNEPQYRYMAPAFEPQVATTLSSPDDVHTHAPSSDVLSAEQNTEITRARNEVEKVDRAKKSSLRQALQEKDPNIINDLCEQPHGMRKASGKRKWYDHGASNVGDLAEDGVSDASNASRPAKGRRLQGLLEGRLVASFRSPSPSQTTPRCPASAPSQPRQPQTRLRHTAEQDLRMSEFMPDPARPVCASFNARDLTRSDGRRRCLPACTQAACCGSARNRFERVAGVPTDTSYREPTSASRPMSKPAAVDSTTKASGGRAAVPTEGSVRLFHDQANVCRQNHERAPSPPGYWEVDMPGTQELEALRKDVGS